MAIEVLSPHGFCAGVKGALERAHRYPTACCLHEIVHNALVVDELKAKGMRFVESLADVPDGETVIFSAHGVSPAVRAAAEARGLKVVDATCPFVARVHREARAFAERGLDVVVIGHRGHAEVAGIVGEVSGAGILDQHPSTAYIYPDLPPDGSHIGVVSQTTMNADEVAEIVAALRTRFTVEVAAQVCHATKERQDAVKAFDGDALIVLGGANSSNTRRLAEVARCPAHRVGTLAELDALDLTGVERLGITAGASTPEEFLRESVQRLKGRMVLVAGAGASASAGAGASAGQRISPERSESAKRMPWQGCADKGRALPSDH